MNVLQIQDDLKNFSEDQLIKEMQQPSGSAPQFLVLSELNRRKRVKGEFAARQAQQAPTVAEEVVAAAGVPQSGIAGMAEAMAPASAASEGIGTNAPINMRSGGLAQFGNEIRESMGQEIDPYLDQIENEAESKFNVDLDNQDMKGPLGFVGPYPPGFVDRGGFRPGIRDRNQTQIGIGGKGRSRFFSGPARISPIRDMIEPAIAIPRRPLRGGPEMLRSQSLRGYADGGVIRASNGFAGTGKSADDIIKQMEEKDKAKIDENADVENISKDVTAQNTGVRGNVPNYTIEPDIIPLVSDSVEQDILNLQKGLQKERALDRALAIAQAGFGILASDAPTLGQAVGEGASTGLEAYRDANKRYQEGVVDLINARAKIASGRKKGKLTASDIMSNLNKTREQLYGKPGDLAYIKSELDDKTRNQLAAQERYLMNLLKEDYGIDLPVATAIPS